MIDKQETGIVADRKRWTSKQADLLQRQAGRQGNRQKQKKREASKDLDTEAERKKWTGRLADKQADE